VTSDRTLQKKSPFSQELCEMCDSGAIARRENALGIADLDRFMPG
jgi:hypothetical protein